MTEKESAVVDVGKWSWLVISDGGPNDAAVCKQVPTKKQALGVAKIMLEGLGAGKLMIYRVKAKSHKLDLEGVSHD